MTEKKVSAGLLCPSSQPQPGARIFGMVRKTSGGDRIGYFTEALPATSEALALPAPALPTEAFRLAAPCAEHKCRTSSAPIANSAIASRGCSTPW
jgi:hypothetical protein